MDEIFDWDDLEELRPEVGDANKTLKSDRDRCTLGNRPLSLQQQHEGISHLPLGSDANSEGDHARTHSYSGLSVRADIASIMLPPPPPHPSSRHSPAGAAARQLVTDGVIPPSQIFTIEKAIQLQEDLIAEFSKADFQERLHKKWNEAGGDPYRQGKARQEVCFPVQLVALEKYGFEPSKRGVTSSLHAYKQHGAVPEIWSNQLVFEQLLNPDWQNLQKCLQGAPHQKQKKTSPVWLEKLRSLPPVFYSNVGANKVPIGSVTSTGGVELARYIWQDPHGPFCSLDICDTDQDFKESLKVWDFQTVSICRRRLASSTPPPTVMPDGAHFLQACWHGLAVADFLKLGCVPGGKDPALLRRAPLRTIAFLQAFREANASCWEQLTKALRQVKPAYSGSVACQEVVATLCASIRKGATFGVVEARISRAGSVMYSLPADLPASLLHLNITLQGSCILRTMCNEGTHASKASSTVDFDMPVGAVHLFSPFCFEHYFEHQANAASEDAAVTLHCSLLLDDVSELGRAFKSNPTMLEVATVISEAIRVSGAQRSLRLPSLSEVAKQEMTLQRQWMDFAHPSLGGGFFSSVFVETRGQVDDFFFLGRWHTGWQIGDMILEVTKVDIEFRLLKTEGQVTARGKGYRDEGDSTIRGALSDGSHLIMFQAAYRSDSLVIKFEDAEMNVGLKFGLKERPHMVTPLLSYGKDVLQRVRRQALADWSVDDRLPCVKEKSHPLKFLSACNCGPVDKRSRFLRLLLEACEEHLRRRTPVIYASFGSGDLWFDWWVLEALRSKGIAVASAHFIDLIYQPEHVRDASSQDSALRNMAAWLWAEFVPSYAYENVSQFRRNVPKGANLMVQCDADFPGINLAEYVSKQGLLCWLKGEGGEVGVWLRDRRGDLARVRFYQTAYAGAGGTVTVTSKH